MTRGRQFRELLQRGGMVIAPGAYDCITARTQRSGASESISLAG